MYIFAFVFFRFSAQVYEKVNFKRCLCSDLLLLYSFHRLLCCSLRYIFVLENPKKKTPKVSNYIS